MCFVALFEVIVLIMVSLTSSLSEPFTGTKVSVNIRRVKLPTPTGLPWYANVAVVTLFWNTYMAAVMSSINNLFLEVYIYLPLEE